MRVWMSLSFALLIPFTAFAAPVFSHDLHVEEEELACSDCHVDFSFRAEMPKADMCLECHEDEDEYGVIPNRPLSHFGDYRHEHAFEAGASGGDCALCHGDSEECSLCHHGENVDFLSHDRNHRYLHALDAMKGTEDCASCHDTVAFCESCHVSEGVMPLNHRQSSWGNMGGHKAEARQDLGSCLPCHGGPAPTCTTCHN